MARSGALWGRIAVVSLSVVMGTLAWGGTARADTATQYDRYEFLKVAFSRVGVVNCDAYVQLQECYLSNVSAATRKLLAAKVRLVVKTWLGYLKNSRSNTRQFLSRQCHQYYTKTKLSIERTAEGAHCSSAGPGNAAVLKGPSRLRGCWISGSTSSAAAAKKTAMRLASKNVFSRGGTYGGFYLSDSTHVWYLSTNHTSGIRWRYRMTKQICATRNAFTLTLYNPRNFKWAGGPSMTYSAHTGAAKKLHFRFVGQAGVCRKLSRTIVARKVCKAKIVMRGAPPPRGTEQWQVRLVDDTTDIRHGTYKKWYASGRLQIKGTYKRGLKEGVWTTYHENGKKSSAGKMVDGNVHGMWRTYHTNGRPRNAGRYKRGQLTGKWVGHHSNGKKRYVMRYRDNKKHGIAYTWHENGKPESETNFVRGVKNGALSGSLTLLRVQN